MSPSDSNKNSAWAQLSHSNKTSWGEKSTSLHDRKKRKYLPKIKSQEKTFLINNFVSSKHKVPFHYRFMTFLHYTNISKPNTLWTILSKCFYGGTFRLICFRFWQAQCSFFVSFLLNQLSLILLFFGNISILPKIFWLNLFYEYQRAQSVKTRIRIWIK